MTNTGETMTETEDETRRGNLIFQTPLTFQAKPAVCDQEGKQ